MRLSPVHRDGEVKNDDGARMVRSPQSHFLPVGAAAVPTSERGDMPRVETIRAVGSASFSDIGFTSGSPSGALRSLTLLFPLAARYCVVYCYVVRLRLSPLPVRGRPSF
jgi:hypothetical protein